MAWSPVQRIYAGLVRVEAPGDYATLNSNQLRDATETRSPMRLVMLVVVDCPACGKLMRLATVVPAFADHAEIRSYKCVSCGEVRATEIDVATRRERPIVLADRP